MGRSRATERKIKQAPPECARGQGVLEFDGDPSTIVRRLQTPAPSGCVRIPGLTFSAFSTYHSRSFEKCSLTACSPLERLSLGCTVQYGERERPEPPGAIRFRGPGRSRSPYCICRLPYTDTIFALVTDRHSHPQYSNQETPAIGDLFDHLGSRHPRAMSGFGLNANQHRRFSRLCFLQSRSELEAMSGNDAVVVIGRSDQCRRIFHTRFDVVKRRIGIERFEFVRMV